MSQLPNRIFKYAQAFQKHEIAACPPPAYQELEMDAHRYVFEDLNDGRNFLPVLLLQPERINRMKNAVEKCHGFGLSLFVTEEKAVGNYQYWMERTGGNFASIVGNYLAKLALQKEDGVISKPEKSGHLTFHEYSDCQLKNRVVSVIKI